MRWFDNMRSRELWLIGAILAFLGAAVVGSVQVYNTMNSLLWNYRTGTWLIVEAQAEHHNALVALKDFQLAPDLAHLQELTVRFDVFWSRVPLILKSSEGEDIRRLPLILSNAQRIADQLPLLDRDLQLIRVGDAESVAAFLDRLSSLDPLLEEMTRRVLVQDELRNQTGYLAREIWLTVLTLLIAVVAGIALVVGNILKQRDILNLLNQYRETEAIRLSQLAVIESSGDGVVMFDADGRLEYSNEAFHGLIEDDFKATQNRKHWGDFLLASAAERVQKDIRNRQPGESWQGEVTGKTLLGNERSWEIHVLIRPKGALTMLVRDLSDRKEAALQREALLSRVHHIDKMEAVGRLAGGVAHDFNNILAAISGFGSLLDQDLASQPAQHRMVRQMLAAADRGKELVQSIMTYSRADKLDFAVIDAAKVLREAAAMVMSTMSGEARFDVTIDPHEMPISGNATKINRAVVNLCINARDALNGKDGVVSLDARPVFIDGGRMQGMQGTPVTGAIDAPVIVEPLPDHRTRMLIGVLTGAPNTYLRIRITDNGSGISESVMRQMFEPFFTTKLAGEGTGLGLSSVLGIVVAHGGGIVVESGPGTGTSFDIFLPLLSEMDRRAEAPRSKPDEPFFSIDGLRILVVDDDNESRGALSAILDKIGCETSVCENGREALAVLHDEPELFDAVITDYLMPEMNGLQLASELRKSGFERPIILTTGNLRDAPEDARARLAVNFVIPKPFTIVEVANVIRHLADAAVARRLQARRAVAPSQTP
jgi:signal transduction histidine kinase/ActR/RegA family two-component response regulator